jgi:hypothetical protein
MLMFITVTKPPKKGYYLLHSIQGSQSIVEA